MKIGIESQRIFRTAKHGMDVVALELIRQFQKLNIGNEYILYARNGPDRNCIIDTTDFHTRIVSGVSYADWEQIALPAALKKTTPDLVHFTANTAPLNSPVRYLLTLHDIIYLEKNGFGGSAYQHFGNLYRRAVVPNAVKKAKAIITVSEYEKTAIMNKFGLDPSFVTVVYNGVDKRFNPGYSAEETRLFRQEYHLPESFLLFLGNTAPKKNTAGAIKAYIHYCYIQKDPLPLVVTDYKKERVEKLLNQLNRTDLVRNFIFPGYVPSAKMPLLYSCSTLFLYPSYRESFGLPVLEAMACGVPVITSNTSAIPEIAGDAAILADPENEKEIGQAIQRLCMNRLDRETLIRKGIDRAAGFSWETSARQLIRLYESIV